MARDLTSDFITEIEAKVLRAELLVKMDFDADPLYAWTGIGSISWDGDTYAGVGDLASFARMEESSVIRATGTVLILSGVKTSLISIALNSNYQGRKAEIYFAVLDTSNAIVADPYRIFSGRMDVMEIENNGEEATISVSVENELIDLFKARVRNYTPEDQKTLYPSDKGLDFIVGIQDAEIIWKEKT